MEIPKATIYAVYRQDKQKPEKKHTFSEVVLLDKRMSADHPLLYKLQLDALSIENHQYLCSASPPSLQPTLKLLSCEVDFIDWHNKEIVLTDTSTVGYKYLIILNGDSSSKYDDDKDNLVAAGINFLQDAFRIRQLDPLPTLDAHHSTSLKMTQNYSAPKITDTVTNDQIKLLESLLNLSKSQQQTSNSLHEKRLIQFQT